MLTFVVPVGDEKVFEKCFLSSPLIKKNDRYQVIIQRNYNNSALAFNDAIDKSENDIIVIAHQDVIIPPKWEAQCLNQMDIIEKKGKHIGIVGCIGLTFENILKGHVFRYNKERHKGDSLPSEVQTLDEMLIIIRKSSGIRFDIKLPGFFFYGMDICMQSISMDLNNYAIDAPCFHQAKNRNNIMPASYWRAYKYILKKWNKYLPIYTNSGPITGYNSYCKRRVEELINKIGFPPTPWWKDLPEIDPDKILNEDK